ncbi:hypothetical protein VP01_5349g2 [Puccinia sorghi]|uniref:Uncharacterized protein n=1 Tax=Puccinia sorghi TaxID=27349 RepID=A0A0L6UK27_9BASI|nr:hypothetical protein VP01_5349g2 [Puccinia sorghi]
MALLVSSHTHLTSPKSKSKPCKQVVARVCSNLLHPSRIPRLKLPSSVHPSKVVILLNLANIRSSQPSPFSFPTLQSNQPTCTNELAIAAFPAPSQEAQSNLPPTSTPTFSFGRSSSQAVSVFGSQPEPTAISASASQDTPNPTPVSSSINTPSATPFTFGSQPTTTNSASSNNEPPASNGMCDNMVDANPTTSTTTTLNIFGGSASAPSNPMSAPLTGFSFSNVNTNTGTQTTKAELTFGGPTSTTTTPSFSFGGPTTALSSVALLLA